MFQDLQSASMTPGLRVDADLAWDGRGGEEGEEDGEIVDLSESGAII